jgi:hypothetical protein
MAHSYRTFVRSGVSTKPGQDQVFNPGEYVEGSSTILYALLLAGLSWIFGRAMYWISVGLNLAFVALANGRLKTAVVCGAAVAVVSVPYLLWRHSYYGDFLRNTYYAKVARTL